MESEITWLSATTTATIATSGLSTLKDLAASHTSGIQILKISFSFSFFPCSRVVVFFCLQRHRAPLVLRPSSSPSLFPSFFSPLVSLSPCQDDKWRNSHVVTAAGCFSCSTWACTTISPKVFEMTYERWPPGCTHWRPLLRSLDNQVFSSETSLFFPRPFLNIGTRQTDTTQKIKNRVTLSVTATAPVTALALSFGPASWLSRRNKVPLTPTR